MDQHTSTLAWNAKQVLVRKHEGADSCWEWTGSLSSGGYGRTHFAGATIVVHRMAYEAHVGPIPEGLQIDHLCRNRACCNPAHLEPVTAQVNILRGETIAASRAAQTHCVNGHEFTERNTRIRDGRHRTCIECTRIRARAYKAKIRSQKTSH